MVRCEGWHLLRFSLIPTRSFFTPKGTAGVKKLRAGCTSEDGTTEGASALCSSCSTPFQMHLLFYIEDERSGMAFGALQRRCIAKRWEDGTTAGALVPSFEVHLRWSHPCSASHQPFTTNKARPSKAYRGWHLRYIEDVRCAQPPFHFFFLI